MQFDTNFKIINTNLKFKDLTRYSNTQKTKMQLGGMMGEMAPIQTITAIFTPKLCCHLRSKCFHKYLKWGFIS